MTAPDLPLTPKRTGRWLIVTASVLLMIAGALAFRPLQVAYHRWQMDRGRAYAMGKRTAFGPGDFLWVGSRKTDHLNHHAKRLCELGVLANPRYPLRHLHQVKGTEEYDDFIRTAMMTLPHVIVHAGGDGRGRVAIEPFVEKSDVEKWHEFVATHDVPDYREQFMADETQ